MSVSIVGVAESDLGVTGQPVLALQAQAISRALADAGLDLSSVDGLASTGAGRFGVVQTADYLGLRPDWIESTFAGGSAFEMYVARARDAIETGQCSTVVVVFASNQRSARSRSLDGGIDTTLPEAQFEAPYGPLFPISYYAMVAQQYLERYGVTRAAFAEVAVAAREWALLNPQAYRFRSGPLTQRDVLDSPMVSTPLGTLDCCLVTDGGGAVVITSTERARDLAQVPIEVLGCGESTTNISMTAERNPLQSGAVSAGRRAFAQAGVTPADIDVAQLYDSFTITVLLTLEALGFCGFGEAVDLVAGGRIRPGGALPLNTSGGGLSYCHPGQFGVLLLVEAVRQLRGQCGARQVPGARLAVAHGTGGILSTHATVILGRSS